MFSRVGELAIIREQFIVDIRCGAAPGFAVQPRMDRWTDVAPTCHPHANLMLATCGLSTEADCRNEPCSSNDAKMMTRNIT
jgi:hypothetical protein